MENFEILSVDKADYNDLIEYKVRFNRNNHAFIMYYYGDGVQLSEKELEPIFRKELHELLRIEESIDFKSDCQPINRTQRSDTIEFIGQLWSVVFIASASILIITTFTDIWVDSKYYEQIFYKIYKSCLLLLIISFGFARSLLENKNKKNSWQKEMDDILNNIK